VTDELLAIETRVGHTGAQELRFRGHRVFGELLGRTTAEQMLMCGITGRILDADDMLVIDDILTAMSSADPRLWPFKITRLAAAHGNAAIAMGATFVASQGSIFGVNRFEQIANVLTDLRSRNLNDEELLAVLKQGTVGFGILYGRYDVRFDALVGQVVKRGRDQRPHMRVALQAVRIARAQLNTEPHVFVAIAALCLDMGMSPSEVGVLGMLPLFHDALPNAAEGAEQHPASLQELPSTAVQYVGRAPRVSDKARDPSR
jgi:hypothetical protein